MRQIQIKREYYLPRHHHNNEFKFNKIIYFSNPQLKSNHNNVLGKYHFSHFIQTLILILNLKIWEEILTSFIRQPRKIIFKQLISIKYFNKINNQCFINIETNHFFDKYFCFVMFYLNIKFVIIIIKYILFKNNVKSVTLD